MRLRPYQQAAIDGIDAALSQGSSALIVCPTGCGKTIIFGHFIAKQGRRTLVLAHREELIFQAQAKIHQITGLKPEIEMGELRAPGSMWVGSPVLISTIQTQNAGRLDNKRMEQFKPEEFDLIVVDECHHTTSASYTRVLDYFKQGNPAIKILGCTATPDRSDKQALGKIFERVAYEYEIPNAIADGWLVPISQRTVHVEGLDYSSVRTTAGDLNGADLAAIMEFEENLHGIASPTIELAAGRKTLLFASSLAHAERLCEIINRHKEGSAKFVHGKTPKEDRREMLTEYKAGSFQFLVNVGVATEGFDEPGIELVVMARPTKSRSLYTQMAGRGFRPHDSIAHELGDCDDAGMRRLMIFNSPKPQLELLDFVGNSGRHSLVTSADILGGDYSDAVIARAKKKAEAANGEAVDMFGAMDDAQREIEEEAERAQRRKLAAKAKYTTSSVNPFDLFGPRPAQDWGRDSGPSSNGATEKQVALLAKWKVPNANTMTKAEATREIGKRMARRKAGLASEGQMNILSKRGINAEAMSFAEASVAIDAIATREGWKKK